MEAKHHADHLHREGTLYVLIIFLNNIYIGQHNILVVLKRKILKWFCVNALVSPYSMFKYLKSNIHYNMF
jgi:hypothetical protein